MSNFDLRKYLAENKLVTEDKIDMINQYAKRIATGEEIQDEFFMDNKEEILQVADEIEKYMNSDIDMEEVKKPSTKMTRRKLKEMIKAAFIAEETNAQYFYDPMEEAEEQEVASEEEIEDIIYVIDRITRGKNDPYNESKIAEAKDEEEEMDSETKEILDSLEDLKAQADDEKFKTLLDNALTMVRQHMQGDRKLDLEALKNAIKKGDFNAFAEFQRSVTEAKDEEETDVTVDAEEETTDDGEGKLANDSIVVDKKIVSLSSLPQQTRKILDSLETLRAQAEEFGDQKFITQVGNTITFFTRDFVVAGDQPTKEKVDESLEILKMKKLAGLLTEGEYAKALLKEYELDDNKLQAFIDRYNKLPRKMGTLDGGDKSYIKDYIKSNPTKLEGEFDDALFSDEAATKFLNGLLDTPRGQNISFMKAKSQYKSKPSWVTGNDANPWGPGYDYEEYEEIPGI